MRYIVFTFDGYGLPIAWRLKHEGAEVLVAQVENQSDVLSELERNLSEEEKEEKRRRLSLYDGLLDKAPANKVIRDLCKQKDRSDTFLFFDLNHLFKFAEEVSGLGYPGNYPTSLDYMYEIDRELAKKTVRENYPSVRVGDNYRFDKVDDALTFLESTDEVWVLKGLEEDARTVVPDVDDCDLAKGQIAAALTSDRSEYESAGFLLERFIPSSLEFTPQKIYWNGEPVCTLMVLENKSLGAGNVGPLTDCAQDLTFLTEMDDKINQIAFPPFVDELAKSHRGLFYWDASLLIDGRSGKIYFGEFCANRPGYNALYNQIGLTGSATKYFESLAEGKCPFKDNEVGVAVRLFNLHEDDEGRPRSGASIEFKPRAEKDLWLTDLTSRRGRYVNSGAKPTIGVVTGSGHSIRDASRRCHRSIDDFSFEGVFYRPQFDLVSRKYRTSIVNRIEYGLQRGFYKIGFGVC